MHKMLAVVCLFLMAASLAMAQGTAKGDTAYTPNIDIFGAHLNGGRGCAACHAPHNGGRGSGSYTGTGAGVDGNEALWGTDVTPVMGKQFATGPGGAATFTISATAGWEDAQFKHIGTCLSCHDGNFSTGPMMAGYSWEQAQGMLDFSGVAPGGAHLYGTANIPTLLGNDGSGAGNYENDHPVGPLAKIYDVLGSTNTGANGVTLSRSKATSTSVNVTVAAGTAYEKFVANYGYPAIKAARMDIGNDDPAQAYIVCTTCHNQHNMVVYAAGGRNVNIAGSSTGKYRTYFFVKGPYNPGAPYDKVTAPSTIDRKSVV